VPSASPTSAPTGPATPPSTNFLGYISYYWGDPKLWTINCGAPVYYPPNTCLPVTASGATKVSGPALAAGEFVAIYANPSTANSKGITAIAFATSLTPFAGSPLPPGYIGPTPAPTASANPTPAPTASANPTPAPTPSGSSTLVDWPTYGYDVQRSGFNPYTTGITPASISQLHVAWQKNIGGAQTQPIIATNVAGHAALLIVATFDTARAFDALTGTQVWSHALPRQDVQDCGSGGISGTAQYDKALGAIFMAAGDGKGAPNHTILYRLDVASGAITGQVDVTPTILAGEADYAHTGIALANGRVYLGTGSSCEGTSIGRPSWRGRVVSVDENSMALLNTFYTTYGQGGHNYGGGGVWAWGGVSADPSGNIYVATGNAETPDTISQTIAAPFESTTNEQAAYAEHLVKLSGDLSAVEGSDYPGFNFAIGYADLDYAGTPVIYQPPLTSGCGLLSATQGKGGTLVINDAQTLAKVGSFALSVPSGEALYIGNPAYSPNTGYLYAAITSAGNGSALYQPGLAAIGGCGTSISWRAQFGPDSAAYSGPNPRSAPTVTAGGVVFIGTPCTSNGSGGCGAPGALNGAVWAVDGLTGNVLGGGKPVLVTGDNIRMAPSADGLWVFVLDGSGNFYGLTVDPSVKAVALKPALHILSNMRIRGR
jgi:hypothetical protein